jgi:NAD(P)-dependent dehydrogenase (short-subunit alcohol dehydrogenase family)
MIDFRDQVAIVTGAGRGLGRLYAIELAKRGAAVVVNDLGSSVHGEGSDSTVADQVVAEIREAGGVAVASYDSVATPEGGAAIVDTAVDHFGGLHALVSNAGIFQTVDFDRLQTDDWRRMLSVHLDGAFHLSQPAFRVMKSEGYGRFVFIASSAGLFGQPQAAHYAAAKAGTVGLANVIAIEGAPHGILANCVLPFGYSRMITDTVGDREQLAEESAFFHAIDPQLVVPMAVFLASRACDVTHHSFSACAGRYARVFIGLAEGWLPQADNARLRRAGRTPTVEDIADQLAAVSATERFTIPESIFDEVADVCTRLGIVGSPS